MHSNGEARYHTSPGKTLREERVVRLAKFKWSPSGRLGVARVDADRVTPLELSSQYPSLSAILEADAPAAVAQSLADGGPEMALADVTLTAPVDAQEIWAAGVTYKRSRAARMEESVTAASCYDRVYASPRPELFLKATPHRVAGPGCPVRIRADSRWSVPEPELTLVFDSRLRLVGCTVGNDMSCRDIEGDNPLYLPQAKVYDQSAAVGPWLTLIDAMPPREQTAISLLVRRKGKSIYEASVGVDQMARSFEDLAEWLGRDNSFPHGVMLMTGTGIVPPRDFTLQSGDWIEITIDGIGTLSNPVVQG